MRDVVRALFVNCLNLDVNLVDGAVGEIIGVVPCDDVVLGDKDVLVPEFPFWVNELRKFFFCWNREERLNFGR